METEPMTLLVNSSMGIYAYHDLAVMYRLFVGNKTLEEFFDGESTDRVFHPDNSDWCENIDWAENNGLKVEDNQGILWRVESIDGDIWAIHPDAEWHEEDETYLIKEED